AFAMAGLADAEIGLGHVDEALALVAKALAMMESSGDRLYLVSSSQLYAGVYASAGRADLATPLIDRLLSDAGSGDQYSARLLGIDPVWDPIRKDPLFEALVKKHTDVSSAISMQAASTKR